MAEGVSQAAREARQAFLMAEAPDEESPAHQGDFGVKDGGKGHGLLLVRRLAGGGRLDVFDDAAGVIGGVDVAGDRRLRFEELVAFDAQPGRPDEAFKFADAHRAEFRETHAEIAQAPGHILVFGIELGQQPGARSRG